MPVRAAYLYESGKRVRSVAVDEANPCGPRSEFVWIGLETPKQEELASLQAYYGLHPLAIEDAANAHQQPKLEVYGDQLFVVAKTAALNGDSIEYGETAIFVGRNHIITVRHGSARPHTKLRQQLESAPSLLAHGVDYVLHGILDFIVDGYVPIVQDIEEEALALEQRASASFLTRTEIGRLFSLRRELVRFHRVLGPTAELCGRLVRIDLPNIDEDARPYFRDVLDHLQRLGSRVDALQDILRSVFELSMLFEQQRQSVTTRQLAAWAAILAVPTAIAGIYGMNFQNMPELTWRYGYFGVLAVIAVACAVLFVRFRRAGWL
ncbi:magnesium/cobalt transporter CorA [Sphingomonas sp. GCM10030256]|uniref:magnesium/cobalt transporter CorA n=1 Tax=Sphingomonas sp. GCM10030256 TaxID=3273427 RepID=UPI003611EAA8